MIHGTHNAEHDERNEHIQIYVNGEFLPRKDAKISVFDSGYLVGDGIWEGIRLHKGKLVFIEEHLKRMWQAAKATGITLKWTKEELMGLIHQVLSINKMEDHVHIRVMVTRGIKKTPSQDPRLTISGPNLVIIAEHKKASEESRKKGISLFTSTIRRGSPDYLDPKLNCHSKLHEVQALIQAIEVCKFVHVFKRVKSLSLNPSPLDREVQGRSRCCLNDFLYCFFLFKIILKPHLRSLSAFRPMKLRNWLSTKSSLVLAQACFLASLSSLSCSFFVFKPLVPT